MPRDELRARRIERLAAELAERLRRDGSVREDIADLDVDVETWRAAGRRAGRLLGWSIRTLVHEETGRVWLLDNRDEDELPLPERRAREQRLREMINRIDYGL